MHIKISSFGDSALIISFGQEINIQTHHAVMALAKYLDDHVIPGVLEYVPAFTTVTVFYDPLERNYAEMVEWAQSAVDHLSSAPSGVPRVVEIPVCYGGDFGPDLESVAQHNHLSTNEVIAIHTSVDYLVYMIGFSPGFPYLGGMPEQIATPRLTSPRLSVPAGSVGIAGKQTGVYPTSSPGGWQLIGRTPLPLFRPSQYPPSLLSAGDTVRFRAISHEEYQSLHKEWFTP